MVRLSCALVEIFVFPLPTWAFDNVLLSIINYIIPSQAAKKNSVITLQKRDSCVIPRITHHITLQKRESHFRSVILPLGSVQLSRSVIEITLCTSKHTSLWAGPSARVKGCRARPAGDINSYFSATEKLFRWFSPEWTDGKHFGQMTWKWNEMRLYSCTHYLTAKLSTPYTTVDELVDDLLTSFQHREPIQQLWTDLFD